jgi:F420-0:gamma-glutamyl ligase-like protein
MYINEQKDEIITVNGTRYSRFAIKTHVITDQDDLMEVVKEYVLDNYQEDDLLFISEKMVACTQKRAIRINDIKPRKLAVFLAGFVTKTPSGIGLGMPETMEMAFRECGTVRILFATFVGACGKLFKKRGWFYYVAGEKARGIDGPCKYTLAPYNECVVLIPNNPQKLSQEIADKFKIKVAIVDSNDFGVNILGLSDNSTYETETLCEILKDNPLGQSNQQTPMGIIRRVRT